MNHDEVSPAQRRFWHQQTAMRMMLMLPEEKADAEAVLMYVRQLAEEYLGIDCDAIPRPTDLETRCVLSNSGNVVRMKAVE